MIGKVKRVIKKEKPKENLVSKEDIVFPLPKKPAILDNEDFEQKQEIKKTTGWWNKGKNWFEQA